MKNDESTQSHEAKMTEEAAMAASQSLAYGKMDPENKLRLQVDENPEEEGTPASKDFQYLASLEMDFPRASDLLMMVTVSAEVNKPKITSLAMSALEELTQLALGQEAMWLVDPSSATYVLNEAEYRSRFSRLDPTLEKILSLLKTEGPGELPNLSGIVESFPIEDGPLQRQASQETQLVHSDLFHLVAMFMDVDQWSAVFSSVVSKAKVLGVLSTGENGSLDGALKVMMAEFHVPSPLVQTRESYFLRYCKQLSSDTWAVVDASLESIFPNPATRFIRRPSGCLIQALGNGCSKVKWIEHVEADNTTIHYLFRRIVATGFAFHATRWLGTLARQCERNAALMDHRVMILQEGRKSLLTLTDRMMRSYFNGISATRDNVWKPIPVIGAEDILATTRYNFDDPRTPQGVAIAIATTIWLPTTPKGVFDFLRNGNLRSQWDLLSLNSNAKELVHINTGSDPANNVSIIAVDTSPLIYYLQESQASPTGCYVVYAPIEVLAMNSVLAGERTDDIQILSSGFAVLPDRPTLGEEEAGGTLLTIAFQICDKEASTAEYLPPKTVITLHTIISQTASLIRTAVMQ
ncbi:homeobox-leucine zipper protein MERISTEM L1-like [Diospyros lotus]|uniref:homeobox-leucine zipper protein MERISTEM L1-like n=1 Tax=Diospyros lotus TaxID=55363 RepID=UPI002251AF32|nr:homeobox-leucine zipper protein MERISTEM L1-like [Diospyros lotus]